MAKPLSQAGPDIGTRLTALAKSHQDPQLRQVMGRLGKAAQGDAEKAARGDLGSDAAFSGWVRGKPIPLATRTRYLGDGQQYVGPTGRAAGPWTVAQAGRSGLGQFQGPGVNRRTGLTMRTKTGKIRNSRARARRNNGRTKGKNTAVKARQITARETPKRLRKESLTVIARAFRGR